HYLNLIRQPFNVNSLAQVAACAALHDDDHFQKTLQVVAEGRDYLYQELQCSGIAYVPTQSNFLMVRIGKDCDEVYERMLRRGVVIRPLSSFGFQEYIRVTVGTREENERFIKALREVLVSL
ncbi:MAG: aminotransferase class I/II-fold pyridoxal phosphate-dependent enzyme, partial [Rubrivivax sp.]|nr:aminotransferase class I/II-fold pyridoxal phosphate-dependent enzyme [Rubrivivax sp.]